MGSLPDHFEAQIAAGETIYDGDDEDLVFFSPMKVNNSSISASLTCSGTGGSGSWAAWALTIAIRCDGEDPDGGRSGAGSSHPHTAGALFGALPRGMPRAWDWACTFSCRTCRYIAGCRGVFCLLDFGVRFGDILDIASYLYFTQLLATNVGIFIKEHFMNNFLAQMGFGSNYAEGQVDSVGGIIGSLDRIDAVQYDENNVAIVVHNTMGWASGTRIPGEDISVFQDSYRSDFGPGGTIWQVFYWIESIPPR